MDIIRDELYGHAFTLDLSPELVTVNERYALQIVYRCKVDFCADKSPGKTLLFMDCAHLLHLLALSSLQNSGVRLFINFIVMFMCFKPLSADIACSIANKLLAAKTPDRQITMGNRHPQC